MRSKGRRTRGGECLRTKGKIRGGGKGGKKKRNKDSL